MRLTPCALEKHVQLRRDGGVAAQSEHHGATIHRPQNAAGSQLRDAVLPVLVLARADVNGETGLRARQF